MARDPVIRIYEQRNRTSSLMLLGILGLFLALGAVLVLYIVQGFALAGNNQITWTYLHFGFTLLAVSGGLAFLTRSVDNGLIVLASLSGMVAFVLSLIALILRFNFFNDTTSSFAPGLILVLLFDAVLTVVGAAAAILGLLGLVDAAQQIVERNRASGKQKDTSAASVTRELLLQTAAAFNGGHVPQAYQQHLQKHL